MDSLLRTFAAASGLRVHHCAINHDRSIEFDGFNADGSRFHIASGPNPANDPLRTARVLGLMQRHQVMEKLEQAINFGATVTEQSKGKAFTERLKRFREDHAADIDARAGKYDALVAKRAELSKRLDSMEAADHAELEAIDAELRQMGNDL